MSRLFLFALLATGASATELTIVQGKNESVRLPNVRRVAIADAKVAGVKALPPDRILVTARKVGKTRILAWDEKGNETPFEIEVIPSGVWTEIEAERVLAVSLEFLEVDNLDERKIGIHWPETLSFRGTAGWQGGEPEFSLTGETARGWLMQLYREGHARVVAKPELSVRVGEEAVFHSGGEFPVATSSTSWGGSRRAFEWKGYGLTVKVRPDSKDGLTVRSDVSVEVSELNGATAVEGIPGLNKRSIVTKINAREGEPVVLSGLVRQLESHKAGGVPVLKDVPILGALFRESADSKDRSELVLSITFHNATRALKADRLKRYRESVLGESEG